MNHKNEIFIKTVSSVGVAALALCIGIATTNVETSSASTNNSNHTDSATVVKQYNQSLFLKKLKEKNVAVQVAIHNINQDALNYTGTDERLSTASNSVKEQYNNLNNLYYDAISVKAGEGKYTYPSISQTTTKVSDSEMENYVDNLVSPVITGLTANNANYSNVVQVEAQEEKEREEAAAAAAAAQAQARAAAASNTRSSSSTTTTYTRNGRTYTTYRSTGSSYNSSSSAYNMRVSNSGGQSAINACAGGATNYSPISNYLGKSYYAQHSNCGGSSFPGVGGTVTINGTRYRVTGQQNLNYNTNTAADISKGYDAYYQTCTTGGGPVRVMGLTKE